MLSSFCVVLSSSLLHFWITDCVKGKNTVGAKLGFSCALSSSSTPQNMWSCKVAQILCLGFLEQVTYICKTFLSLTWNCSTLLYTFLKKGGQECRQHTRSRYSLGSHHDIMMFCCWVSIICSVSSSFQLGVEIFKHGINVILLSVTEAEVVSTKLIFWGFFLFPLFYILFLMSLNNNSITPCHEVSLKFFAVRRHLYWPVRHCLPFPDQLKQCWTAEVIDKILALWKLKKPVFTMSSFLLTRSFWFFSIP